MKSRTRSTAFISPQLDIDLLRLDISRHAKFKILEEKNTNHDYERI